MDLTKVTPFSDIFDRFLSKITDDMYMELTELETENLLEELLLSAIPQFEFPRVPLLGNYKTKELVEISEYEGVESNQLPAIAQIYAPGYFLVKLSDEEIDILATYMIVEWIEQQLASIENIRMKYSGDDFKFTSQANHLSKLINLEKEYTRKGFHLQRLYKRRKIDKNGIMRSTFGEIMEKSVRGDGFI